MVDATDNVIPHFDEDHISISVEANFIRLIQFSLRCRTAIARIALFATAHDRRQLTRLQIQPSDSMILNFANIQCTVRPHGNSEWLSDIDAKRGPSVAVVV